MSEISTDSPDFDAFLSNIVPSDRNFDPDKINPPLHQEEKRLVLTAIYGTLAKGKEKPPIVKVGVEKTRSDSFKVLMNMGKGPYHFFELPRGTRMTNLAREWFTHIAALAKLYYEEGFPPESMKFEYNHKYAAKKPSDFDGRYPTNKEAMTFPMDIVVFGPSKEMLLYVEVKKRRKEVNDLLRYLEDNRAPHINVPDRRVPHGDEIRKAKYLWYTRVSRIWLACPENLSNPGEDCFDIRYDYTERSIHLQRNTSIIQQVRQILRNESRSPAVEEKNCFKEQCQ